MSVTVETNHRSSWRVWSVVTLLVAAFYGLYGSHFMGHVVMPVHANGCGTYDALAESFLNGHAYLNMTPRDPRVWDVRFDISGYHGRHYLYWGPAPVVLLYLPFRAMFEKGLADVWPAFTFLFGSYLFGSTLLRRIHERYYASLGPLSLASALLVLGFGNLSLYLIKQSRIYEVAAAGGVFFFMGGSCFLAHCMLDWDHNGDSRSTRYGKLMLGSLFFGFCLLTRPTHVLAIALLMVIMITYLFSHRHRIKRLWLHLLSLTLPALLCVCLWCFYNWIRFADIRELGHNLPNNGMPDTLFFWRAMLRGFYLQILQPPFLSIHAPYISSKGMDTVASALSFNLPGYAYNTIGLLLLTPYLLGVPLFFCKPLSKVKAQRGFTLTALTLALGLSLMATFAFILSFAVNDLRYPADYLSSALLLAALGWFARLDGTGSRVLNAVMLIVSLISVLAHLTVGFHLY